MSRNIWTPEEENQLKDLYKTKTNAELANMLRTSEASIRMRLHRLKLVRTPEDWLKMAEEGNLYARKMYEAKTRTKRAKGATQHTHKLPTEKADNRANPEQFVINKPSTGKLVQIGKGIWKEVAQ
jgi:hypothetical protein